MSTITVSILDWGVFSSFHYNISSCDLLHDTDIIHRILQFAKWLCCLNSSKCQCFPESDHKIYVPKLHSSACFMPMLSLFTFLTFIKSMNETHL